MHCAWLETWKRRIYCPHGARPPHYTSFLGNTLMTDTITKPKAILEPELNALAVCLKVLA